MSIRSIQTAAVIDEIANALFASGIDPTVDQIMQQVSKYFSKYPVGNPLPMPFDSIQSKLPSDTDRFNLLLLHLAMNVDFAYQASNEQVNDILVLTALLQAYLRRLEIRRTNLSSKVDDFLLSLNNTDGYYFSVSDSFADVGQTDLKYTSAFVDTGNNLVSIPGVSSLTKIVDPNNIGTPNVVTVANDITVGYTTIAPFSFATNGLSNTVWEIQVNTTTPSEVVATITIPLNSVHLTELNYDPYGVNPVQVAAEIGSTAGTGGTGSNFAPFGSAIQTSSSTMSFLVGSDVVATAIRLTLRKTQYDYTIQKSGQLNYVYIFGASNLVLSQKVYDSQAMWVSGPLALPTDLANGDMVIDAVSLIVKENMPVNTTVDYFVALDPGNATQLSDFNWKAISPVGSQTQNINSVVHFNGAQTYKVYIKDHPGSGDLQLTPFDITNFDFSQRNPSPTIIKGVDVYRLAKFTDSPLINSLALEEGVNSTRIFWTDYVKAAVDNLDYWGEQIANGNPFIEYGHIDTGNGFFYGGDIGQNGASVYAETFLDATEAGAIVDLLKKTEQNSQTWSIRTYLNGAEIGWLPGRNTDTSEAPQDSKLLSWNFVKGLNHIVLTINIPPTSAVAGVTNPYIGTVDLMAAHNLYDFGDVNLGNWTYVDFFDLQYNTVGNPQTYTIYNGEIISRRQPTTNFLLKYNKPSSTQIDAVRLRADLQRDANNPTVSPQLLSYRLRFQYGVSE